MADTITHTAWAYSADGTDRFTTVYPNLNLITNTKTQSYTSTGTAANTSPSFYSVSGTKSDIENKQVTISYEYLITNSVGIWSGTIRPTYGLGGTNKQVSNTNLSGTHKETVTLGGVGFTSYAITVTGLPAGTTVTITNLKVEYGSIATPWLSSSSEVTTADYPSYIGTYRDTTVDGSTDPSKYVWVKANTGTKTITVIKGDFATNSGKYKVAVGGAGLDPLLTTLGFNDEVITVVRPDGGGFDYYSSVQVTISEGEVFESGYVEVYNETNTLSDTYTLKYIEGSNKAYYQYKYDDATTLMKVYITFYTAPTDETVVPTFNHVYSMLPSELDQLMVEGFGVNTPSGTIDLRTYMLNLLSFPFSIPPDFIGEREKIVLGEYTRETETTALKGDIIQYSLGSIEVPLKYKNAYDFYSAETTLILPYTENISLPPEYVIGATISVEYVVEVYKGTVNINVTSSKTGKPIYNGTTSIGRQIPFISYWKILGDESIYTSVYNNQTKAIIEVKRKQPLQLEYGTDVSEYGTIGDYTGYIEVTEVGLIGSTMGGYEQEQLLSILNKGVIL